jgi:hypothetical protein
MVNPSLLVCALVDQLPAFCTSATAAAVLTQVAAATAAFADG